MLSDRNIDIYKNYFRWEDKFLKSTIKIGELETCIFDIETYPNLTAIVAIDKDGIHEFDTDDSDFLIKTRSFFENKHTFFIGFNNHSFDNIILSNLSDKPSINCKLAGDIIDKQDSSKKFNKEYLIFNSKTIDVIGLLGPKDPKNLKGVACKRNPYRIQELPYKPNTKLDENQKRNIIAYCINDVYETNVLFNKKTEDIYLRLNLYHTYSLPNKDISKILSAKGSSLAEYIIMFLYEKNNIKPDSVVDIYGKFETISGSEFLPDLTFISKNFELAYNNVKNKNVNNITFALSLKNEFWSDDNIYSFGSGGLHAAQFYKNNNKKVIIEDRDVTSYYPSMMLKYKIKPRSFNNDFFKIFDKIVKDRKQAKSDGNKFLSDALKLVINSTFGKFKNISFDTTTKGSIKDVVEEYKNSTKMDREAILTDKIQHIVHESDDVYSSPLYDWKSCLQVTLHGQFLLTKLCDEYIKNNIKIISINTDGIVIEYTEDQKKLIFDIDETWSNLSGMQLEYTRYSKVFQNDVNNYTFLKEDGELKCKGRYEEGNANNANIIHKSISEYMINNVDPKDYILNNNNISDYVILANIRDPYYALYDGKDYKHIVRFYHSSSGKPLDKCKNLYHNNRIVKKIDKFPNASSVTIINTLPSELPKDIDKGRYIREVEDMLCLSGWLF